MRGSKHSVILLRLIYETLNISYALCSVRRHNSFKFGGSHMYTPVYSLCFQIGSH